MFFWHEVLNAGRKKCIRIIFGALFFSFTEFGLETARIRESQCLYKVCIIKDARIELDKIDTIVNLCPIEHLSFYIALYEGMDIVTKGLNYNWFLVLIH